MGLHQGAPAMRFATWKELHPTRTTCEGGDEARILLACEFTTSTLDTAWGRLASMDARERMNDGPLVGYFRAYGHLHMGIVTLTTMADQAKGKDAERAISSLAWELRGLQCRVEDLASIPEIRRTIDNALTLIDTTRYRASKVGEQQ